MWQGMGAVIHRSLPRDVLDRFRTAMGDAQENIAAGDADYNILLHSQRDFLKENGVRSSSLPGRRYRLERTDYESDLKVTS